MIQHSIKKLTSSLFFCLCITTLSSTLVWNNSFALSTDRDQPADIEADDIEFDFKKGTRTYIGNVLAIQGTLKLKADKFVANYKDSKLSDATAWGSLARFRQRPDGKEHDVEGWAKKIVVNQAANTLTLIGKAAIKQGSDTARGDTIIYNMTNDTLQVKGRANMQGGGKKPASKPKQSSGSNANSKAAQQAAAQQRAAAKAKAKEELFKDNADGPKEQEGGATIVTPTKSGRSRLIIQPK